MIYLTAVVEALAAAHANPSPLTSSNLREVALADGLRTIAKHHGKTLQEPVQWDARGEFKFTLADGVYGDEIAALLNEIHVRTGVLPMKGHVMSSGNWCRINHFDVERMIQIAHEKASDNTMSEPQA